MDGIREFSALILEEHFFYFRLGMQDKPQVLTAAISLDLLKLVYDT